MKDQPTPRICVYGRVSTSHQATEGTSLETQRARCLLSIEARYGFLPKDIIFIEDAGISGSTLNRTGIQQVIKLIQDRKLDLLVFFSLDRLSRSQLDMLSILSLLQETKTSILSVSEPSLETTTPMGSFIISLLGNLAQLERANILERLHRGKSHIKSLGKFSGGAVPYGYRASKAAEGGLEIVEEEGAVVKTIFYYRKRLKFGYKKIANHLNNRGFKKRDCGAWTPLAVKRILENFDFYRGKEALHANQSVSKHPPIL